MDFGGRHPREHHLTDLTSARFISSHTAIFDLDLHFSLLSLDMGRLAAEGRVDKIKAAAGRHPICGTRETRVGVRSERNRVNRLAIFVEDPQRCAVPMVDAVL
jgi:hypothetical protein